MKGIIAKLIEKFVTQHYYNRGMALWMGIIIGIITYIILRICY